MGSSNSRPKICQVAPSHSEAIEEEPPLHPASHWMIMQEKGILGQRRSNHLPPLTGRQEAPHIVSLEPGSQRVCNTTADSIIKSHPPQPAKGWKPMSPSTRLHENPAKHTHTNAASEGTEWSDGPVRRCSTPSLTGRCGTSNTTQGRVKGLLLAQTMLCRQATKKRRAQQKCFRERQGGQKRICVSDPVDAADTEGRQRVQLVSRPTQRNIFWDESEGQILDMRELLQPSPELTDPEVED